MSRSYGETITLRVTRGGSGYGVTVECDHHPLDPEWLRIVADLRESLWFKIEKENIEQAQRIMVESLWKDERE